MAVGSTANGCKWHLSTAMAAVSPYQLQIPTLKISKVALVCISWGCKDHQ
jgi:hypothetical protein